MCRMVWFVSAVLPAAQIGTAQAVNSQLAPRKTPSAFGLTRHATHVPPGQPVIALCHVPVAVVSAVVVQSSTAPPP